MGVAVGDGGVATDTGGLVVGTNVPTHIVTTRTFHVVVAHDLTLGIGCVGVNVLRALVVTWL